MSNQNKKNRARRRQQKTGVKYTEARREQEAREAMPDWAQETNLLARFGRESEPLDGFQMRVIGPEDLPPTREHCDNCGGAIKWVRLAGLREHRPERADEVLALGSDFSAGDAWVCLECDSFGIVSLPQFEDFSPDFLTSLGIRSDDDYSDSVATCQQCRARLEWVDPASVAYSHREAYMKAKAEFGATELLWHSSASVCTRCGDVRFHPHHPPLI